MEEELPTRFITSMRNSIFKLIVIAFLSALTGCMNPHPTQDYTTKSGIGLIKENMKAGHELLLLLKINAEAHQAPIYPKSLAELADQLRQAGIDPKIPQCLCSDGIRRDFEYIPSLGMTDGPDFVVLFSPKEMADDLTIVVNLDGKPAVLISEEANNEIERARAWARKSSEK
jgi:hypothetical protein